MSDEESFEDALAMRRSPRLSHKSLTLTTPPPSPQQQRSAIKYTEVNLIKSHNTPTSQRNRLVALFFTILFLLGMLWISVFDTHQDSDVGGPNSEVMLEQSMVETMIYLGVVMILLGICTCWSGLRVHQEDESNRIRVVRGDSDLDKMTEEDGPTGQQRAQMCEPSEQQRVWAEQALGKT